MSTANRLRISTLTRPAKISRIVTANRLRISTTSENTSLFDVESSSLIEAKSMTFEKTSYVDGESPSAFELRSEIEIFETVVK